MKIVTYERFSVGRFPDDFQGVKNCHSEGFHLTKKYLEYWDTLLSKSLLRIEDSQTWNEIFPDEEMHFWDVLLKETSDGNWRKKFASTRVVKVWLIFPRNDFYNLENLYRYFQIHSLQIMISDSQKNFLKRSHPNFRRSFVLLKD